MRVECYKNEHAMYEYNTGLSVIMNAVVVIVVECGDVRMAASGIYDVYANSPNMATPTTNIQSPTRCMHVIS